MSSLTDRSKQAIADIFKTSRNRDERLIIVLLVVALSTVFIFGNDRGHFNRAYDWTSSSTMALAANLSPEHNFLMFHYQTLGHEGKPTYVPYNRYPIGGYILIKLAILPFQNDLSAQIYAARILTLILFSATVVLAYLALARITNNRWAALAATMLSFASYNMLYHTDMIGEGVVSLFGVMLTFHGMVIFIQESRFRQLLIKTCVALLLGWHVYALLLVFILFGIANELVRNRSNIFSMPTRLNRLKATSAILIKSKYLVLGIVALLFGISMLTFNLTNEYLALNRETPLTELPSFKSIISRTGINPVHVESNPDVLNWPNFFRIQIYRIGGMSIPYHLPGYKLDRSELNVVIIGVIALLAAFASLRFTRHKILIAALVLSGILWTVVMRSTTGIHFYETIFLIGIPLAVFSICFNKLPSKRLIAGTAVFALIIFALSAYQMSLIGHSERAAKFQAETLEDFQAIREIADDKVIYLHYSWVVLRLPPFVPHFYLAGNIILFEEHGKAREFAELVSTLENETQLGLLTPENKRIFLYDRQLYDQQYQAIYDMAQSTEPVISSQFNVYLDQNTLFYVKEQCETADLEAKFMLHIDPVNRNALPEERRQFGFDNLDFDFNLHGSRFNQKCAAQRQLPEYEIASIRTGQFISNKGEFRRMWSGSYDIPQATYDMAQSTESVIRSHFNVHLGQNTLFYIKEQCETADIEARFLLHILPVNRDVLPEERRQFAFDNLDFDFAQHGGIFDQKCAAQIQLPEYEIASIRTGQYIHGEGELWSEWYEFPQVQQ